MNRKHFTDIFKTLMTQVHFLRKGPPPPPWNGEDADGSAVETSDQVGVRFIRKSQRYLPPIYQAAFTKPAVKHFHDSDLTMFFFSKKEGKVPAVELVENPAFETVVGAVYQHDPAYKMVRHIRRLLAVVSNLHRSFLDEARCKKAGLPNHKLPPLASFNHNPFEDKTITAFVLVSIDAAIQSLGTKVPVISIPSSYRNDILLWLVLVHEVCGHPILNSIPNLLCELRYRLATEKLSDGEPVITANSRVAKDVLLAVWRYWMEEACSDVMATLNMGPAYGLGWPLFITCLGCNCRSVEKIENTLVFSTNGKNPLGRVRISFVGIQNLLQQSHTRPELLAQSLQNSPQRPVSLVNPHVAIGAIQALDRLNASRREAYIRRIGQITDFCSKQGSDMIGILVEDKTFEPVLEKFGKPRSSGVKGPQIFVLPTGARSRNLLRVRGNSASLKKLAIGNRKTLVVSRSEMQRIAQRVGQYIATVKLEALGWHSLCDLETWDDTDEETACRIAGFLADKKPVAGMGDDAHLLAGGMLAFYENPNPKLYKSINKRLGEALDVSYECDPIWGQTHSPRFLEK